MFSKSVRDAGVDEVRACSIIRRWRVHEATTGHSIRLSVYLYYLKFRLEAVRSSLAR